MAKIIIGTNDTNMAPAFVKEVGSSPVINSLTIAPTTSSQSIVAPSGVDGYSPITVSAVDSSIDQNIVASNIKDGVTILGVTGNYTGSGGSRFGVNLDNFIGTLNNGSISTPTQIPSVTFTGLRNIDTYQSLQYAFYGKDFGPQATISFPDLRTISANLSCYGMFQNINQNVSYSTTNRTVIEFPNLTQIGGTQTCAYMFDGAKNIRSVSFPNLYHIIGDATCQNMFSNTTAFTSIYFPKLSQVSRSNVLNYAFYNSYVVAIHFRADAKSEIEVLDGYSSKFGATDATIYFDL